MKKILQYEPYFTQLMISDMIQLKKEESWLLFGLNNESSSIIDVVVEPKACYDNMVAWLPIHVSCISRFLLQWQQIKQK